MKNCLHCGKPLEDWETVCSGCGTPVIVPEQTKVCPSCGKVVKAGAAFCMQCGHRFEQAPPKERICEACGAVLANQTGHCPYCGHTVGTQYVRPAPSRPVAVQPEPDPGCMRLSRVWKVLAYLTWIVGFIGTIILTAEANTYWGGESPTYVFFYYLAATGFGGLFMLSVGVFFRVLGEKNKK